jgi:hypothetical protein
MQQYCASWDIRDFPLRNALTVSFRGPGDNEIMFIRLDRAHRVFPVMLGVVTLAGVGALFTWDAFPQMFPARSHDFLAAFSLAMIAVAYILYQIAHRPAPLEFAKALMLAVAFLFWAANQLWPHLPQATLFNDIAIALFVLDIFLIMVGWPATSPDESFAETYAESRHDRQW